MPLSSLELNVIRNAILTANKIITEVKPVLDSMNIIYDSGGGAKTTITQQNMDAYSNLSGLTKQQLDDGLFALTGTIRGDLVNAYSQLAELAARI
jgi:hypothetical protein